MMVLACRYTKNTLTFVNYLTLQGPMSLSYRNQSTDLRGKSIDWFLYERDIGR